LVGLGVEQKKKIGALSKGYRQRVGLAQAIIHNPEVLILDEPTSGLDPNQLVEIRSLIKNIGKEKTVMLSTHIMQEVEAICDRAIFIKEGNIVANDTILNLSKNTGDIKVITVEFEGSCSKNQLLKISGVIEAINANGNIWVIKSTGKKDVRPLIFEMAVKNNLAVLSLNTEERSMEDIFKDLTGKK